MTVLASGSTGSPGEASGSQHPDAGIPPLIVDVRAAPTIPPATVDRVLEEAAAIWRTIGVTFEWRREELERSTLISASSRPRVIIVDSHGTPRENAAPLGWITFIGEEPGGEINISRRNAEQMLVGVMRPMTPAERSLLLGRMMGRALAHELGHYLLRSKTHRTSGLMKSRRTVKEFIDPPRSSFAIETLDGTLAAARIREVHDQALRRPDVVVRLMPARPAR